MSKPQKSSPKNDKLRWKAIVAVRSGQPERAMALLAQANRGK